MLRSLRSRLIFSHILPIVIVVPIMYLTLVYMLETRFLVPRLTEELLENARFLSEITRAQYISEFSPREFEIILNQIKLNPAIRVIYLGLDGTLQYSNDPSYFFNLSEKLEVPGLRQVLAGEEFIQVKYSIWGPSDDFIQVLIPVPGVRQEIAGILWMSYYAASVNELFGNFRLLSVLVMIGFLIAGAILGSILALSIGQPVQQVTQAIQGLARGKRSEPLAEQGPEEIRDLIRAANFLLDRLKTLEQARRQLLANLVHELGRPLGALRSAIQALAKGAGQDPLLLEELTTGMDEEASRLQRILDDLAHLYEQVLGPLEIHLESVDLSVWLPRLLTPWQEAAIEKRLHWQVEIPTGLPQVQIDKVRFAQVIGNILSNAIKYTPDGRSVSLTAGQAEGEVWIRIEDTGPGIHPDEQEKIFQPFYRGDQGRRIKQGMGLGLSIASELIAAHGGRLQVESVPGFGSAFTVWLPIRRVEVNNLPHLETDGVDG